MVGIDGVTVVGRVYRDEIPDVAIAERARWEVGDDVIGISDDIKLFPTHGNGIGHAAVEDTRASESKAVDGFLQVGAVEIEKFMAKHRKRRTVAVADDDNTGECGVGNEGFYVGLDAFPAFEKACVTFPFGIHFAVWDGMEGEIVDPIARTVARLKIEIECISTARKIPTHLFVGISVVATQTVAKQVIEHAFFHCKHAQIQFILQAFTDKRFLNPQKIVQGNSAYARRSIAR